MISFIKTFVFIIFLLSLCDCARFSGAVSEKFSSPSETPITQTSTDTNGKKITEIQQAEPDFDESQRVEIKKLADNYKIVPDEWKKIDFKNFSFPIDEMKGFIHLKNGEFEYSNKDRTDNHFGSGGAVYYIDLTGDSNKEAIVFVTDVSCGASCDGGAAIIYFYSIEDQKLKLLARIETGSMEGGCNLKSFQIKNKEITLEQFGRCVKKSYVSDYEKEVTFGKGIIKDLTVSRYIFDGNHLKKESAGIITTPLVDTKNYSDKVVYSIE